MSEYPIPEELQEMLKGLTAPLDVGGGLNSISCDDVIDLIWRIGKLETDNKALLGELKAAVGNLTMTMLLMDTESRKCAMRCITAHKAVIAKAEARAALAGKKPPCSTP